MDSEEMGNAIGKEFVQVGNERVVQKSLEELNRVDLSQLDDDTLHAYSDALKALTWLREGLKEGERRPNAKVHEPYGVID